jgi:AbrB family looped-hinge helix DNA binding protein
MGTAEAKVTSKGQITLPSEVRQKLNVGPGDRVVFVDVATGDIVVRRRSGTLGDMRGMLRDKVRLSEPDLIETWVGEARSRAVSRPQKRARKSR